MLNVNQLNISFESNKEFLTAVKDISFEINPGDFVGLIGESGSGKSVTALSIMNLLPSNARRTGDISWNGAPLKPSASLKHTIRQTSIGMIFQNPMLAFNPVITIGKHFIETIKLHQKVTTHDAETIAIRALDQVHITDPAKRLHQYPHEFSLGMCQRAMIALTLTMQPSLLIADEPTASLDVTVQAQIMDLLTEINQELNTAILFISHDLGVIAQHCDYVYVMYLSNIVEHGDTVRIFTKPQHSYTKRLLSAIPNPIPT